MNRFLRTSVNFPSKLHGEKVSQQLFPFASHYRLRMKLNSVHRMLPVSQPHNFALRRFGDDFQLVRQSFATHDQGMVSSRFERDRKPKKNSVPFVQDLGSLPMHQTIGPYDLSSIHLTNALMPKADP